MHGFWFGVEFSCNSFQSTMRGFITNFALILRRVRALKSGAGDRGSEILNQIRILAPLRPAMTRPLPSGSKYPIMRRLLGNSNYSTDLG